MTFPLEAPIDVVWVWELKWRVYLEYSEPVLYLGMVMICNQLKFAHTCLHWFNIYDSKSEE